MLDDTQILNILGQELSQSAGGDMGGDSIQANREAALATYLGQSDGREVEGRSTVVSTDVADAIEWIMPEIMKAFTQNNEVVAFDPEFEGDEDQARLESQYTFDILMKENDGFIIVHEFVKDALMQKNGFVKVFYQEVPINTTERYTGLTEIEYNVTLADPELELLEESIEIRDGIPIFDVKVKRTSMRKKICVESIAPEDFRVNRMHNSVSLKDARFTAHVISTTRSDLISQGYDKGLVFSIPSNEDSSVDDRDYRFSMQGETVQGLGSTVDPALQSIELIEASMMIDIDEDGIAELVKVTAAGSDENPTVILDTEEIDENPFISSTCILMSHKLFGLSIYDRLEQIQKTKTTLWRNILDNVYLQNNQRTIVLDNMVNMDDLLVSRPGGVLREKVAGAIRPYVTPPLSADAYKMMDYADQVRTGRAGVTPDGPIKDVAIGDRVGSEGVADLMTQREELVGLMIRVIAETGIKPLCYKIRDNVIKHQDTAKDYQYRGQWIQVNPSAWRNRTRTTVRVGTGSGNRKDQMMVVDRILGFQQAKLEKPNQVLVTPEQEFNAIDDFARFGGLTGAGKYILDPKSPQGKQNAKRIGEFNAKLQQMEKQKEAVALEFQRKIADAETSKATTAEANVALKAKLEEYKIKLQAAESRSDTEIDLMKQELAELQSIVDSREADEELQFKYWDRKKYYEVEKERLNKTNGASGESSNE